MKKIICLFFIISTIVSCKKETMVIDGGSKNISIKKGVFLYKNIAFTGVALFYYESKNLKKKCFYQKGKLHGKEIVWYDNGEIFSERHYKEGVKIGIHRGWWENGNKKFEFHFNDNGEHHGEANEWFVDGTPYKLFHYENGIEEGSQKMFKPNGNIRANYVVVAGERFGLIGLKKCDAVSTM